MALAMLHAASLSQLCAVTPAGETTSRRNNARRLPRSSALRHACSWRRGESVHGSIMPVQRAMLAHALPPIGGPQRGGLLRARCAVSAPAQTISTGDVDGVPELLRQKFKRLAIVNRGEPAMRCIHAVREYNAENGTHIKTIALYTEPDKTALFVREADEAYSLGGAFVTTSKGERKSAYLDYAGLEKALRESGADAVWPGWGFVSEHAEFADLCTSMGIVFIGPSGHTMRLVGDKIASKEMAIKAKVPTVPWSEGAVRTLEEAHAAGERIGYPLMIKASAGGGGRGIRKVMNPDELKTQLEDCQAESLKGFGDDRVFMERMVQQARHIEVQMVSDGYGTVWALGTRDCSVQRRNQKIIEEGPCPCLNDEQDKAVREAAIRLGLASGYCNAGTVEFLFDQVTKEFWFMEVNSRLQVEHTVTELNTGVDLVKTQLHIASGGRLDPAGPPPMQGWAIEVRLNAEDPDNSFAPSPGKIDLFRVPTGPGIRCDTGVEEGDVIAPEFDSMVAKILAKGNTRQEALARLRRALLETSVSVAGGQTNKAFLMQLLETPEVQSSNHDNTWLDKLYGRGEKISGATRGDVALLQAAIVMYNKEKELAKKRFFTSAARGRPAVNEKVGQTVQFAYQGETYEMKVRQVGLTNYEITVDERTVAVDVENLGRAGYKLLIGGARYRTMAIMQGLTCLVEVDGISHKVSADQGGAVRAPAPGVVVKVLVKEGETIVVGQRLAVLEAMKMELSVNADYAGTVRKVMVQNNVQIAAGDPLVVIEPQADESAAQAVKGSRIDFTPLSKPKDTSYEALITKLHRYVLGYDILPNEVMSISPQIGKDRDTKVDTILASFLDVISLFQRAVTGDLTTSDVTTAGEGINMEQDRRTAEDWMFKYLRTLDPDSSDLPDKFLNRLKATVGHYGVTSLKVSPQLEEALFRIFTAHSFLSNRSEPILSLLEAQVASISTPRSVLDATAACPPSYRELLDRVVQESRNRYPSIFEIGVELRYRMCDQPFLDGLRQRTTEQVQSLLDVLMADPTGPHVDDYVETLAEIPQPLQSALTERCIRADKPAQTLMLRVMTERYYKIRKLRSLKTGIMDQHPYVTFDYKNDYRGDTSTIFVVAMFIKYGELELALREAGVLMQRAPEGSTIVLDFYAYRVMTNERPPADVTMKEIDEVLAKVPMPANLKRIVVVVSGGQMAVGLTADEHYTYRRNSRGELREEHPENMGYWFNTPYGKVLHRGLHPMNAKRMEIWRLENFTLSELPTTVSGGDMVLYKGISKENPKDERLFVLASVRDLSPAPATEAGHIRLPSLERILMESLAAIRRAQNERPARNKYYWNRILLYVWPTLDMPLKDFAMFLRDLSNEIHGFGLEKVAVSVRTPAADGSGLLEDKVLEMQDMGGNARIVMRSPSVAPLLPLTNYTRKVVQLHRRGLTYPYELIKILCNAKVAGMLESRSGDFIEYDLADPHRNQLVPVNRPMGENSANIIIGVIKNYSDRYPEGMQRVILLGDPSRAMGSLSEAECRRILGAFDLAESMQVPVEWFACSAGALIAMDSGTENMDWIARVLRRIINFTQDGFEVNIVVAGINVGAQPYWNAEATMLMHTKGILIMTPNSSMVLTGKRALEFSGGVSAEDNEGIGGYERIMGPNGQAQYFAADLANACSLLLMHYNYAYVSPGERFPRRALTTDPITRDIRPFPHGVEFETVGGVLSETENKGRKKTFKIRKVMQSVCDGDHATMERWYGMEDAEIAVVWDAVIGGYPVTMLGIESQPLRRFGFVPSYGPDVWTAGTLFPQSSKKLARAINATSGGRPLVILANLSGFDGSPESMRNVQLEFGAEIGRAVVNFKGPIIFTVISRYHGGAFVVFSKTLNDDMEVSAVEGSHASVIGGAPAAAVVFTQEVKRRVEKDARVTALMAEIEAAPASAKGSLRSRLAELKEEVNAEKMGEVATEFDTVHNVYRAKEVGSVDKIIKAADLRPYLVDAIERGIRREEARRAAVLKRR
eukprot:jgi/Mesvir1/28958/Mv17735-RA.1